MANRRIPVARRPLVAKRDRVASHQVDETLAGEEIAFLHRMDSVEGEAIVALTDRPSLRNASFLDGRESFWREQFLSPLDLRPQRTGERASRFVFHVGFAGSTLLARLLDRPGHAIVLKEPQCLADIAGQRELIDAGKAIAPLDRLLDFALSALGTVGNDEIPVVVKPTNWVNPLLPRLCIPERVDHAVFISMTRRHYLGATFRGGNERLAFCARLAGQTAPVVPRGSELLQAAMAATAEPFARMARIMALLHWFQEWLFDDAIARNDWPGSVRIGFEEIIADPGSVLQRAQGLLALPVLAPESERAAVLMKRHTKDPSSAFRPAKRAREDEFVEDRYGACFDEALDWLEAQLARPG